MSFVECISCDEGVMVPIHSIYEFEYRDKIIKMLNVDMYRCASKYCKECVYKMDRLFTNVQLAKDNYDLTGETTYECISR